MPPINLGFGIWLLPLIGLVLAVVIIWQVRRTTKTTQITVPDKEVNKGETAVPSRRKALESTKVAWGLWHTGQRMRAEKLISAKSLQRILLLNPESNESIDEVARRVGGELRKERERLIQEINDTIAEALANQKAPRLYAKHRESSLTIYDSTPIKDANGDLIPNSDNAWIYLEILVPNVGIDQWKDEIIYNKGKDKQRFMGYFKEYEAIWNDSKQAYLNRSYLKQDITVKPVTGKRARNEQNKKTAWAELKIINASEINLQEVSVQIVELVQVYEKQDGQGIGTGIYHLHEPYPSWNPSNVYWSERIYLPNQLNVNIPPNSTGYAMIAFHEEHAPALGSFNIPTHPQMLESKIKVEISSPNFAIWKGSYYIEYHPVARDEFEFVEWDLWCKSHNVIDESNLDQRDYQP